MYRKMPLSIIGSISALYFFNFLGLSGKAVFSLFLISIFVRAQNQLNFYSQYQWFSRVCGVVGLFLFSFYFYEYNRAIYNGMPGVSIWISGILIAFFAVLLVASIYQLKQKGKL